MMLSASMVGLMQHALGLRPDRRTPFRNHFVAGKNHHDQPDLQALVEMGFMKVVVTPSFLSQEDRVFVCTEEGREAALAHLPPEPAPIKRTQYQEYMRADTGGSFAQWLGINGPKYEVRGRMRQAEYRMFRPDPSCPWYSHGEVSGEWCKTKKEAKASYKEALRQRRGR